MNSYNSALDFLYTQLPMYQRVGAPAYKPGLDTSIWLARQFGDPQRRYRTIHVGGTNGKGSTAHTLAAILQSAGYKTGLYTSPHLVDFRERIRVNGKMIPEDAVTDFVRRYRGMASDGLRYSPSFFELTMVMAFDWFATEGVDVAVLEVGLGGRLDSTNIIIPELCVITNISLDHTQFLGHTHEEIASEKAGIMKPGIPVVIGEAYGNVRKVFAERAETTGSPIVFAEDNPEVEEYVCSRGGYDYRTRCWGRIHGELGGECQPRNANTILAAVDVLVEKGWNIAGDSVEQGFAEVVKTTGLMGRWMRVGDGLPVTVCDTGHNVGGWQYISRQLDTLPGIRHMVIGFVNDKDVSHILEMMPHERVRYYFAQASVSRALPCGDLAALAAEHGLVGKPYAKVSMAVEAAQRDAGIDDSVFVGGSTFVVADFLSLYCRESGKF